MKYYELIEGTFVELDERTFNAEKAASIIVFGAAYVLTNHIVNGSPAYVLLPTTQVRKGTI